MNKFLASFISLIPFVAPMLFPVGSSQMNEEFYSKFTSEEKYALLEYQQNHPNNVLTFGEIKRIIQNAKEKSK